MTEITLTGVFNWNSADRRSDRYGSIILDQYPANVNEGETAPSVNLDPALPFVGRSVVISALVVEARESYHIGDLFRAIFPSTPAVGTEVALGAGTLVAVERYGSGPDQQLVFRRRERDGEPDDWMDPRQLYRLHNQTIKLTIAEVPR